MPTHEPTGRALARRLRELRVNRWPDVRITQGDLAEALSRRHGTSIASISSWEKMDGRAVPHPDRLAAYATFFSSRDSVKQRPFRIVHESALTAEERDDRDRLHQELLRLRELDLAGVVADRTSGTLVGSGPWAFPDGGPVIIVCPELPEEMLAGVPFADPQDPDYTALSRLTDQDALIELIGHVRAVNPDSSVEYRPVSEVHSDDAKAHLVLLGGVDWNDVTHTILEMTRVPVVQSSDDARPNRGAFHITDSDLSFEPVVSPSPEGTQLFEDVGHFFRAPNPFEPRRTVTLCNGMYSRGVYGSVRTLTDKETRDRNAGYLLRQFPEAGAFSVLFRVRMVKAGVVATPDWTAPGTVLHSWSE